MGVMAVVIIILLQDCNPKTSTVVTTRDVKVATPEITGSMVPNNKTEVPSSGIDSIKYKDRYVYSTHPFDKKLAEDFKNAKDSISQMKMYLNAIQVKENITDFSNDKLELKIWSKTRGELLDLKADYKIKPQEVIVQEKTISNTIIKEDKFGVLLTGGYNHSLDANTDSNFEAGAGIRLGKVSILGTANTQKQVGGKLIIEL